MPPNSIINLRKRFELELLVNSKLYHPDDVVRVQTEEFQVKRFLVDNDDNEDRAYDAMIAAMKWKKEYGIHDRDDQYFPKELWEMAGIEINGQDREGRMILWGKQRNSHPIKEGTVLFKQFIAHLINKLDCVSGEKGFVFVLDTNGSGLSNIDIEINKFKIYVVDQYPHANCAMYNVDLPWLLTSVIQLIISFMSAKRKKLVHLIKQNQLTDYIDPIYIPTDLGGLRQKQTFPNDTLPMEKLKHQLRLSDQFVDKFYKLYAPNLGL